MSNSNGPQSHAEAARLAQQSQNQAPGTTTNTSNWSAVARNNYYANGGK